MSVQVNIMAIQWPKSHTPGLLDSSQTRDEALGPHGGADTEGPPAKKSFAWLNFCHNGMQHVTCHAVFLPFTSQVPQ